MVPTEVDAHRPPALELEWLVEYKDGTTLLQNYEKPDEHHFGHIVLEEVSRFWLVGPEGEKHFGVDLERQAIMVGDVPFLVEFPRDADGHVVKGKLVYFRRIRNDFTPDGTIVTVRYAIGLQARLTSRSSGGVESVQNVQQYLFINNDGTFSLSQAK